MRIGDPVVEVLPEHRLVSVLGIAVFRQVGSSDTDRRDCPSNIVDDVPVQLNNNTYTLTNINVDHSVYVVFRRMFSYSLGPIEFDDEQLFKSRILNNNYVDPNNPGLSRLHIIRRIGQEPDPRGVMMMINLKDNDPTSPNFGRIIHAHAKGIFTKTDTDEIKIQFKYLFKVLKTVK